MEFSAVRSIREGGRDLFLLPWPLDGDPVFHGLCFVVMKRAGGMLLAVPVGLFPVEVLQGVGGAGLGSSIGPHTTLSVPAISLAEGEAVSVGEDVEVVVVDVGEEVVGSLVPFAEALVPEEGYLYFGSDPSHLPEPADLLRFSQEWVSLSSAEQVAFYSAEEEPPMPVEEGPQGPKAKQKAKAAAKKGAAAQVAAQIHSISEMLPAVVSQLQKIEEEQKRLQQVVESQAYQFPPRASQAPVSMPLQSFAHLMGSPPRTKGVVLQPPPPKQQKSQMPFPTALLEPQEDKQGPEGSTLAMAMLEQSRALTSLVSHLQQGGDPLLDSQATSSSMSSRGAAGREKLQRELAGRTGGFFLQVLQNAFRRMKPASGTPSSIAEIAATDFSLLQYLERCGGYGNSKELGIIMYSLAFVADAAMKEDMAGVQEHLALLLVSIEQAVQDQNKWDLAFQLTLLEDPPPTMFNYRGYSPQTTGRMRAFAPLCPQRWATVALAFTKELDYIQSRRADAVKKAQPGPQQGPPSPKKRGGKFPKGKAVPPEQQGEEE